MESVILLSIQCNNNNDNNNSLVFWHCYIYFCYFFGFICLLQGRMLTNACIIYFSIKRYTDSKIWKIQFSLLKLNIRRTIKYSDLSGRSHQLMTRVTVLGISILSVLLCLPSRTVSVHRPPLRIIFFLFICLFVFLFCLVDGYVTITNINIYIYIYIYIYYVFMYTYS